MLRVLRYWRQKNTVGTVEIMRVFDLKEKILTFVFGGYNLFRSVGFRFEFNDFHYKSHPKNFQTYIT